MDEAIWRVQGIPGAWVVQSKSDPSTVHLVRVSPIESCTCKGFRYRGTCRHIRAVKQLMSSSRTEAEVRS